jgi:hypothetical protein
MNIDDDPGEFEDIEHLRIRGGCTHVSPVCALRCVALILADMFGNGIKQTLCGGCVPATGAFCQPRFTRPKTKQVKSKMWCEGCKSKTHDTIDCRKIRAAAREGDRQAMKMLVQAAEQVGSSRKRQDGCLVSKGILSFPGSIQQPSKYCSYFEELKLFVYVLTGNTQTDHTFERQLPFPVKDKINALS